MKKENWKKATCLLKAFAFSFLGKKSLYFLIFMLPTFLVSQEKLEQKSAVNSYVDYFKLPRESLFLHTNKTTYIVGESEEIWFKVYAYDRRSHLSSKATRNIHFGFYNKDGEQLDRKLFLAKEGAAVGNMALDSTLPSGDYFLKVSTHWMKNFKEDDSFVKKINIINPKDETFKSKKVNTKEYDIQFLPEGGHILANVKNTIGIKSIDDAGKSTSLNGVIINSKGEEITNIQTNSLGMGKFSFTPTTDETYTAKITLNNTKEIEKELPQIQQTGITLQVNNLVTNDVIINLITNKNTFQKIQGQSFRLLIHKDGVTKILPVTFNNPIEQIRIGKQALFKGVNTVTLFNQEEKPILERMFFNDLPIKKYNIALNKKESVGDSISYQIKVDTKDSLVFNTSISVLPKGTISYNPRHNILSAFYLKPYIKGFIENPKYYFTNVNRKKKYALDLLLLTQGWSRYEWNDIFSNPPKQHFEFQDGITLRGNLNNNLSKAQTLVLYPTRFNGTKFINYDETGRFEIKNFYPLKEEELKFSFTVKKGKAKRPKMVLTSYLDFNKDNIDTSNYEEYKSFYADKNSIPINFLNKNEVLDEIVLSARLDRVFKKKGRAPFSGKIIKITDSVAKQNVTIDRVFSNEPFIIGSGVNVGIESVFKRPIVFYLDGNLVPSMHNFLTTNTTAFEDIYIDYSPTLVYAPNGAPIENAIVINVFSRITPFKDLNLLRTPNNTVKVKHGFEPRKQFYTPRYIAFNIKPFTNYGIIHWQPEAIIRNNNPYELTTINTGLNTDFYIEGISSNGDLISQIIRVEK